jgi:V/A-type H+-transporting ATPase subunit E
LKQRKDYIEESNRQRIAEIKVENHIKMQNFKSRLIEKAFSEAKEKLQDYYQKEEYPEVLNKLIMQAGIILGGGELLVKLNKRDKDKMTPKNLKMLSEKISNKTKKETRLIIEKKGLNTIGGALISLKNQKASIDNTFETLLEENKEKAKTEIEKILFK